MNTVNLDELATWVSETYRLPGAVCEHLRSHSNYVYSVESDSNRFILKLYGTVLQHTDDEILWEIELLDHIAAHGGSVTKAIRSTAGDGLCKYRDYRAVLFEYAPGEKPKPPFSNELYYNEGIALGAIHKAADSFISTHNRKPLDVDYLINKPLPQILSSLTNDDDKQFFVSFSEILAQKISDFAQLGLDFGPIHGDATLDNLHVSGNGTVTWYDFDSGGPGWRAYDLQGWALLENIPDFLEKREAFLKGYQEIRSISTNDLAASPYLHAASELWGFGLDLNRQTLEGAKSIAPTFITERVAAIRNRQAQLRILE